MWEGCELLFENSATSSNQLYAALPYLHVVSGGRLEDIRGKMRGQGALQAALEKPPHMVAVDIPVQQS